MDNRAKELVKKMERERGFGMPWREILAEYDPDLTELYHQTMMHIISDKKGLSRKVKELIQMSLNAVTNYQPGFRAHLKNAINEGATPVEIMEALELAAFIGIHAMSSMLPIMADELKNRHPPA